LGCYQGQSMLTRLSSVLPLKAGTFMQV